MLTSVADPEPEHFGRSRFESLAPVLMNKKKKSLTLFSSFLQTLIEGKLKNRSLKINEILCDVGGMLKKNLSQNLIF